MANIITTQIYKVNGCLVVADSIEDAVKIYKEHLASFGTLHPQVESVVLVKDDCIPPSNFALIRDKGK